MDDCRKILIAVNDSDDALRAVKYVGNFMKNINSSGYHLIHVFPDPPPDYYSQGGTLDAYKAIMENQGEAALDLAIKTLRKYHVPMDKITSDIQLADGRTISDAILEAREKCGCGTLVIGKRGISKNEEFLFGSISNTLSRKSRGFTTWVVG
ncbi:universal stress protein [Desulfogranum japonicum]|uniref:universal stress protein n=1 Tax=Desulfogranum japonicum TaxID=231447 RepID=UPI0003F85BB2|nr:universal stress protein [Desulfogranum japonicum]